MARLQDYLRESRRLVALKLTKQARRELGLAGRAGGREAAGQEPVLAPDRGHRGVVERQQRAGRLQRGRPGVADVEHIRPLAGRGRRQDAVEQVGPTDDLELDGDAGLLLELVQLRLENLLVDRKITLSLDHDAIEWLASKGYDPAYGARPLKRVMQKELQDPLAEKILLGDILDGSTVAVTAGSDRLNFRPRPTVVEGTEAEQAA